MHIEVTRLLKPRCVYMHKIRELTFKYTYTYNVCFTIQCMNIFTQSLWSYTVYT